MAHRFRASIAESLRKRIDEVTGGANAIFPGVVLHVVDKKNTPIFSHASHPHNPETLFAIFSVTKILCTIAFMQLVDLGKVSLDDASVIEDVLPQLCAQKVLVGPNSPLEDRKARITPRMLLNHTNGTGHSLFNKALADFLDRPSNEITDPYTTIVQSPLLWQPGTCANYGQGFDWMGVLVERLTERRFSDVLRYGIFEKMGLRRSGYLGYLEGDMAAFAEQDYWPPTVRKENAFRALESIPRPESNAEHAPLGAGRHVQTGSIGVISCAADLGHLLTVLLPQNSGMDPVSGTRILSADSAAEVMKPQPSSALRKCWGHIPSTNHGLFRPVNLQEDHLDPLGSFGLGCAVQGADRKLLGGRKGRSKGSVYWYGAASTEFWIDSTEGIVVVISGNFFPFGDKTWMNFTAEVEGLVYEGLTT